MDTFYSQLCVKHEMEIQYQTSKLYAHNVSNFQVSMQNFNICCILCVLIRRCGLVLTQQAIEAEKEVHSDIQKK